MKKLIILCWFTLLVIGLSAQNSADQNKQNESILMPIKHYCSGCAGHGFKSCTYCSGSGRAYDQICYVCQGKQYDSCKAPACGARQYTLRQSQIVLENTYRQHRPTYSFPIKYYYIINKAGYYDFYYEDQYGNSQKITE